MSGEHMTLNVLYHMDYIPLMCVLPRSLVNTQVHYNLLWITCVWNYFSTYSISDEGSFFISYKIEAYGWPVPPRNVVLYLL